MNLREILHIKEQHGKDEKTWQRKTAEERRICDICIRGISIINHEIKKEIKISWVKN